MSSCPARRAVSVQSPLKRLRRYRPAARLKCARFLTLDEHESFRPYRNRGPISGASTVSTRNSYRGRGGEGFRTPSTLQVE
jgi:hypothetical protein